MTFRLTALRLCVGIPLFTVVVLATPIGPNFMFAMLGLPALLVAWVFAGLRVLRGALEAVRQRKWRQACGRLAVVAIVAFGACAPFRLARFLNDSADYLNLGVMEPMYDW